jgi:hypothetical protein
MPCPFQQAPGLFVIEFQDRVSICVFEHHDAYSSTLGRNPLEEDPVRGFLLTEAVKD